MVDEEAAEIVKRIYALCIAGKGPMQIAKLLTAKHVLTVKTHYVQRDENRCRRSLTSGARSLLQGYWSGQSTPAAQ